MKKPIIIDMCKIGYISWITVSAGLIFWLLIPISFIMSETEKDTVYHYIDDCRYSQVSEPFYCENGQWVEKLYSYKSIIDSGSSEYGIKLSKSLNDITNSIITLLLINIINWVGWFIILNRKYGKYEFILKTCSQKASEIQSKPEVEHE